MSIFRYFVTPFAQSDDALVFPELVLTNRFDITIKRKQYVIARHTDRPCACMLSVEAGDNQTTEP